MRLDLPYTIDACYVRHAYLIVLGVGMVTVEDKEKANVFLPQRHKGHREKAMSLEVDCNI